MELGSPLTETLRYVATAMAPAQHDWWIIASAAVALHGGAAGEIRDVDVLFDRRDGESVLASIGLKAKQGQPDELFRSEIFVRWDWPPLPVEFFAGFELLEDRQWCAILPASRQALNLSDCRIYLPDRAELKQMLLRFGRPKDLARAALL